MSRYSLSASVVPFDATLYSFSRLPISLFRRSPASGEECWKARIAGPKYVLMNSTQCSGDSDRKRTTSRFSAAAVHLGVSAQQGTQVPWNLVAITIPAVLEASRRKLRALLGRLRV